MSTTRESLAARSCRPLAGAEHALGPGEVQALQSALPGWSVSDDARVLSRDFSFKDYHRTMAFVNAVAWIAHQQDHHPDLDVGYGHCRVRYTTHDVGGLSINDFICAARVDALAAG
jgi:4a-hydroxytetrahydrobiopterin dehydratase